MEPFLLAVTNLGRDEVFIVALALYTWLVRPSGGRDLGVAFALSYLLNTALKYGLDLPRPFQVEPGAASAAAQATAGGPGLPSGHAQMSATLWLGMAAQLRQGPVLVAAATLVALVSASRLLLHVHYPSDVIVGLLLGGAFALLAARAHFPQAQWARWVPPLVVLLAAALVPAGSPREVGAGLGLLAGFWAVRPSFAPPRDWATRLLVGALGLVLVFGVYFALGALPEALKDLGLVRALRYALLVLMAVEVVPAVLRRWLPPQSTADRATMRTVH
ncbi:phosphatase PAP2 family protein [Deinococcus taeanensis]|uniref:phosphatase PAP2 family protein n=1 Tax=Deinococcus taeanensis TaxID=2737050 RepID=UPI001CDBB86F|nr:phosphatase PAP2 family protein [Deinococcus taeanensis]UBV43407.1 phosphatase PAP2 family protein [Deinococcus taeanensis]